MIMINDSMRNNKQYDGNSPKFGITVNKNDYIVKMAKGNTMTVYCEYVASKFIKAIGVPCHTVELGFYTGVYMGQTKQNEVVAIIKDFTSNNGYKLHKFGETQQSSEDTLLPKEYTYEEVIDMIDKHLKMSDTVKQKAKEQFWQMFICDAILGNRDRHKNNWGYLSNGKECRLAPLYDNGSSLFPDVYKVINQYASDFESRKEFMYDRVYKFPACLLMEIRKDTSTNRLRAFRTNYAQVLKDLRKYRILAAMVKRLKEKYTDKDIFNIMQGIVRDIPLNNIYKRFYIEIVTLRFKCLILRQDFDKAYKQVEGWLA